MDNQDEEIAIDIITNKIAEILNEFAVTKDNQKSKKLKEKLEILENIKTELYLNNEAIIKNVLEKNRKGML